MTQHYRSISLGYFLAVVSCTCYFLITKTYSKFLPETVLIDYFLLHNVLSQLQVLLSHLFLNSNQEAFVSLLQKKRHREFLMLIKKILPMYFLSFLVCILLFNFFLCTKLSLNYTVNVCFFSISCVVFYVMAFSWVAQNRTDNWFKMFILQNLLLLILVFLFLKNIQSVDTIILLLGLSYFISGTLFYSNIKRTLKIVKIVLHRRSRATTWNINVHNLYWDVGLFILNAPSVFLPFFISSNDLLIFLATFRLYDISRLIPERYIDSHQGLIMQTFGMGSQGKTLFYNVRKTHFVLTLCCFIGLCCCGKLFLHFWIGMDLDHKLFFVLAIFSLLSNLKEFICYFFFYLSNSFCRHLAKITWIEVFTLGSGLILFNPKTTYHCYLVYIFCTSISFLLFYKYSLTVMRKLSKVE